MKGSKKVSKLSPALYLLLTMTIATLVGLAQPTMAASDITTEAIATSSGNWANAIGQKAPQQNPLSQVRGDLGAVWQHHQVSGPGLFATSSSNDGLGEFTGCSCAVCSGMVTPEIL
jgi:hypothetical protein